MTDAGGGTSVEELLQQATAYGASNPSQCWAARARRTDDTLAELLDRLEEIHSAGGYVSLAEVKSIFTERGFSGDVGNHFKDGCRCRK